MRVNKATKGDFVTFAPHQTSCENKSAKVVKSAARVEARRRAKRPEDERERRSERR